MVMSAIGPCTGPSWARMNDIGYLKLRQTISNATRNFDKPDDRVNDKKNLWLTIKVSPL